MKMKTWKITIASRVAGQTIEVPDEFGARAKSIAERKHLPAEMMENLRSLGASDLIHFTEMCSARGGGSTWKTQVDGLLLVASASDGTLNSITELEADMRDWAASLDTVPEGIFIV